MNSITVTIGRVKHTTKQPMTDAEWANFKGEVVANVSAFAHDYGLVHAQGYDGNGQYDGYAEESYHVTAVTDRGFVNINLVPLRRRLIELAKEYDQDAIAFSVGQSSLLFSVDS